jgi:hypothetical protein
VYKAPTINFDTASAVAYRNARAKMGRDRQCSAPPDPCRHSPAIGDGAARPAQPRRTDRLRHGT